jgi:hypothetical protein
MSNQPSSQQQQIDPQMQQAIQALYVEAAQMMRNGASRKKIISALAAKGVPENIAGTIVDRLESAKRDASRSNAGRDMAIGAVVCIVGLVITLGTYAAASGSSSGGRYVVAWGAIIFGAFQFLRGLKNMAG